MSLFGAWVIFPVLVGLLALGCGLLLERAAGIALPGSLLVPAGIATIIVLAQLPVAAEVPSLATPLVVIAAAAGLALSRPWRRRRPDRWLVGAALALFAVYAAPIVLSGEATFAGYIKLDDTATWLAITDQVMEHGPHVAGLAPSSYEATVSVNLGTGYPYGAFLPLGVGHELTSIDVAWLFQPFMATLGVALMLVLWNLAGWAIERRWLRATVAFFAAQPALLFGVYLWGGVKELAAAMLLAASIALLGPALAGRASVRSLLAPGCAMASLVALLTPAGLVWLGPALVLAAILVWLRVGQRLLVEAAGLAACVAVLSVPVFTSGTLLPAVSDPLNVTDAAGLGNLIKPLSVAQVVGIWPVGDFRLSPNDTVITAALITIAVVTAVWGLITLLRGRLAAPALYVMGVLAGSVALFAVASPWNGAKALAAGSPTVLLAAGIGVAALVRSGRRFEAAVIGSLLAAGVLWSNVLAYREVWLAPRGQLAELERIGKQIAGQGPTLMTEYQPYGVRHFLRKAEPEGASELRRREIFLVNGRTLEKGEFADTDRFALSSLLSYRTLVLRRSPSQSRPPLPYALRSEGSYYEVWQRPPGEARRLGVIEHLGLGSGFDPGGIADCRRVMELAEQAPPRSQLVAAVAPALQVVPLGEQSRPADWPEVEGDAYLVTPEGGGTLTARIGAPRTGDYEFWVGGGISGGLELRVNGQKVGDVRGQLNNAGQYLSLGHGVLHGGTNTVKLVHIDGGWQPGVEAPQGPIGPLVARPVQGSERIIYAIPNEARTFCGRRLDWVEVVRR